MIPDRRLRSHRLVGAGYPTPAAAVRSMLAVQAQDYPASRWAIGLRTPGAVDGDVAAAVDSGEVLRTHVMRPTWHLVARQDVRWLIELTGPRLLAGFAGRLRQLELDPVTVDRAADLMGEALAGHNSMTRAELAGLLETSGIAAGERAYHLLVAAEVKGVLVSGPFRGSENTYMLLSERAPDAPSLDRDEALATLARRYLSTRAPAGERDLSWWSGLTLTESRRAIALAGSIDEPEPATEPVTHLLPNFDEYTVAYRDREPIIHPGLAAQKGVFSYFWGGPLTSGILSNVVLVDGLVVGGWRRKLSSGRVRVEVSALQDGLERAAQAYARFLSRDLTLTTGSTG